MQRCHENDLAGYILAEEGGFEHLRLPARYEPDDACTTSTGFSDPRSLDGELLCPARFPEEEVALLERRLGSYASAAQLQQRPAPREGGIFHEDWWRFYVDPPREFDHIIDSWDMAFKDLKTSSFVCGQKWGLKGADSYLLSQVRGQWDFVRTCQELVAFSQQEPVARRKYVEAKANGPAVLSALRGKITGLIPFEPGQYGSKTARAFAVSPEVEAGNVYLPENAVWVGEFLDEAGLFPNARYNDQVDTMTQALLAAQKLRKKVQEFAPLDGLTRRSPWRNVGGPAHW
jgi:predicted phage terminase large subunit-like protein